MNIQSEYDKEIEGFEEHIINFSSSYLMDKGEFPAMIFILVKHEDGVGLVISPVNHLMDSNENKDIIPKIMPEVLSKLEKDNKTPIAFCLCSETWIRRGKGTNASIEEIKKLPKREALTMFVETEFSSKIIIFDIIRDENGKIIKVPENHRSKDGNVQGRFANLFRKKPSLN